MHHRSNLAVATDRMGFSLSVRTALVTFAAFFAWQALESEGITGSTIILWVLAGLLAIDLLRPTVLQRAAADPEQ